MCRYHEFFAKVWLRRDLSASTHVGDSEKDRDAAAAAGIGTFVWARDYFDWVTDGPSR